MILALIPILPLVGFLINGIWYLMFQAPPGNKKAGAGLTGAIATLSIAGSFLLSLLLFASMMHMPEASRVIETSLFSWIKVADIDLNFALRVDSLSVLFCLVITGVGSLIHLYSIGYMGHDETPGKFFAYLNLFCFSMLVLVLGTSLPVMFLGWEGVGLCSYLLIGYWYEDVEKASAGKKAFIVNRIGDLGFLLGMFLVFTKYGTFEFSKLASLAAQLPPETAWVTAVCLLFFVGCTGKSAQIPLYIWLPDAMAGPTPVSALIHAATMVTSGVYLIARLNFFYSEAPAALEVIAWVGGITAFFAATIALVQQDIKKVLAYSTVSQLGYMFLGCGVGAFGAGVFHVITHAFFKALLFLGAGSVIHALHHEQNILKMGGLRHKLPKTFMVFSVAWLAICGMPPLSGFFSKDEILWMTISSPHAQPVLWLLGSLTAAMTAFYMTRLYVLTFFGKHRGHDLEHVHETPWIMVLPLLVLAVLSAVGGWIGIPHFNWLEHWLSGVVPPPEHGAGASHLPESLEWILMGVSVLMGLSGMVTAILFYRDPARSEKMAARFSRSVKVLFNKWYIDEIYDFLISKPTVSLSEKLWKNIDVGVIDRMVNGLGKASSWTGEAIRTLQSGSVQAYALAFMAGVLAMVGCLIYGLI